LKILYYSSAFHAKHGGSNHSKEFVKFASQNPLVESITIFPEKANTGHTATQPRSKLKSLILNHPLALVGRFFKRNNFQYDGLKKKIEETKPDVVIIRPDNNFLQIPRLKADFPKLVVAAEINTSSFDESYEHIAFQGYFRKRERAAYSAADVNFFVSDYLRDTLVGKGGTAGRDNIVYNGVDPDKFVFNGDVKELRTKLKLPLNKRIIGYLGTLDKHKKVNILIDAFAEVLKAQPDVFLLVVGDGPERPALEEQIAKLGIGHSVHVTGWVPHGAVADYTFSMDMAVHHYANAYGCPQKLLEYLATGLPTVGPDIPFVTKNFEVNKHLLITPAEPHALAKQILSVLENPQLAQKLREGGKAHVVSNFTWQKNANTIIGKINEKLK